ncbi:class I SAM-dependent rRNA methyltransferase [Haliea sp. E1-2-M8]|uniref:class I SAM-dependent rRNA methyltransferase n=1 Tax=Haliea sp. E1-2-M8 TaxID=3064706 RepID=UPI002725D3C2|nr:class I SAM-dependent rRNA methyltransferase [Haliea sp. E1-2-M8]MDO8860237.1 class I SAM-dependent rRNA methyltransferase [Haliea sp. E1-2-M8]
MTADLFLRPGADRRLGAGHLWVYSNEIDVQRSPLQAFTAGDRVAVRKADGVLLGSAYMEPQALICARLYAHGEDRALNAPLLQALAARALASREALLADACYRLIYGDSDGIPGLVVDRFGDYLVLQFHNAGIECYEAEIVAALVALLEPAGILLRADSRSRREQNLPERIEVVYGEVPETVPLRENGVSFQVPVFQGQKTGWFYDHRMARARLAAYAPGKRVLDVYSYIGGWGIQAAVFGASEVHFVDSSATALEGVRGNARLNGLEDRVQLRQGPAAETLQALQHEGETFDLVILDPPAFIQRRKDIKKGIKAYQRINELGLRLLRPGGVLVSGSCSMHLARADLMAAMQGAARRSGCELRVLEQGGQGPDHPVHPLIPETEYLKSVFARRLSPAGI